MPTKHLGVALLIATILTATGCGHHDKKATDTEKTTAEANAIPEIDIASLKDEASILKAMQQVVDARLSDEKKKKENPDYNDNYLELTKLYTEVISASTAYSKTITDPAKAVEFGNKLSAIQDKMYAK